MNAALFALAAAAFGVGTTEFVVMGLLPGLAVDLGVSLPDVGMIIAAYALGVVVGAPVAAVLTNGLPRKAALLALMVMFTLGNLACALAPGYEWLIAARVLTAFCHAAFFGIAANVAAAIVAPARRGQAVALVFAGLTVANIIGVPGGTALGQVFGWRSTFLAVAGIGVVAIALLALMLTARIPGQRANLRAEMRAALRPQVLGAMALTIITSASLFSVFSFIAPILGTVTGLDGTAVAAALVLFGLGMTLGGLIGGRLADRGPGKVLPGMIVTLMTAMAAFALLAPSVPIAFAALFGWGFACFALAPALQLQVMNAASGAPALASTLNQAAFNVGNAAGAALGSVALAAGVALPALPWVGIAIAGLALVMATAPAIARWWATEDTARVLDRPDLYDRLHL